MKRLPAISNTLPELSLQVPIIPKSWHVWIPSSFARTSTNWLDSYFLSFCNQLSCCVFKRISYTILFKSFHSFLTASTNPTRDFAPFITSPSSLVGNFEFQTFSQNLSFIYTEKWCSNFSWFRSVSSRSESI